jgi:hypothetical protein
MLKISIEPKTLEQINAVTAFLPTLAPFLTQASPAPEAPSEPAKKSRQSKASDHVVAVAATPAPTVAFVRPAPAAGAVELTMLRSRLAEISRSGKTQQVKDLLGRYGAQKLTDLAPEKFGEVLAAAETL